MTTEAPLRQNVSPSLSSLLFLKHFSFLEFCAVILKHSKQNREVSDIGPFLDTYPDQEYTRVTVLVN